MHGKEKIIAPILEPHLGCVVEHLTGFDTDQLGTFTREISRPGTQLEAARRKARKGMELSGLKIGMASEGSFGPDPFTGMLPWNVEMLVWIDDTMGLEVVGLAHGAAHDGHLQTGNWAEVEAFAVRVDFPQHQLVMRSQGQEDLRINKDIADWDSLRSCFDYCIHQSNNRQVFVEADRRAFANPSRMQNIERATRDLLLRLKSLCPICEAPGYWVAERQSGLPCSACGHPTTNYRSEVWACLHCKHKTVKPRLDCSTAAPKHCSRCNP